MNPATITLLAMITLALPAAENAVITPKGSFADFDERARAGERLNVVFFGASLTWGANASDPAETSYRAVIRDRLHERYPRAQFYCRDSAIGGTGSPLGAFRLERDVLAHQPDLVFVDFSANDDIYKDDPESLSAYESIIRRLAQANIPVVQVAFPFKWNIKTAELPTMKRLAAHRAIANAYHSGWADAITAICAQVDAGTLRIEDLWVTDGVHPHDAGYRAFAEVAWEGFLNAIESRKQPQVSERMLYPDTYLTLQRFELASLPALPVGWGTVRPNLTAVNHDWLMSRWLDKMACVRNRDLDDKGKPQAQARPVAPLRLHVNASSIILFGEATAGSGRFRVRINNELVTTKDGDTFDANRWKNGNGHLVIELARGLDPSKPHLVEIEPVFDETKDQELRIESLCVAGGRATVALAP